MVPDVKRKLPGRGLWITGDARGDRRGGQAQRVRPRLQARGARRRRSGRTQTERLLERAALDALAIAGKAGRVVDRLRQGRGGDRPAATIVGADPRRRRRRRRQAQARRGRCGATATKRRGKSRSSTHLPAAQLDLALGRSNVVHAALLAGPASETFLARVARLERFRTGIKPDGAARHAPTDGARGIRTE